MNDAAENRLGNKLFVNIKEINQAGTRKYWGIAEIVDFDERCL